MTEQTGGKALNIWQLFTDDEHTAADGAYVRALRARKWILLSAGLLAIVSLGFFKAVAFEQLIRIVAFSPKHLFHIALAGTAYLYAQYLFLLVQLLTVYAGLLHERLFKRQFDDVSHATEEHAQAQSDLEAVKLAIKNSSPGTGREAHEKNERDLKRAVVLASSRLEALEASDPHRNQTFTVMEVAIDTLRLVPPLLIGAAALFTALTSPLGLEFWREMAAIGIPTPQDPPS